MKKNNKFLALALGTVLSLSMLAGCGDSAEDRKSTRLNSSHS